jgi:hypothetical protein
MSQHIHHCNSCYQAEPLQQQNNQLTMEIATAVAANDNSEQAAIENNAHSK